MTSSIGTAARPEARSLPVKDDDLPLLYEDEEEGEMGEANIHVLSEEICRNGLKAHLGPQSRYRVFSNMNLYYHPRDPNAYVSPDTMLVEPFREMGEDVKSYRIGDDGPAPKLTIEVLSARTAQQRDLEEKVSLYAQLKIPEYILVDVSGIYLPQRLLLKRLQPDGTWKDEQDPDGGVTSQLGFRLIIASDGQLRVLNAGTGERYARPDEAEEEARARRQAEEQRRAEAEARRQAEEQRRAEAEARRRAEEQRRAEAEARRQAEEQRRAEAEARRQAEEQRRAEAEARRRAEERIRALEAELERLRGPAPDSEKQ
jgi:Uma2 family endonuclease